MSRFKHPIFILCMHRTGSTLLRNILDQHSSLAMAPDEMHLSAPLRDTFCRRFARLGRRGDDSVFIESILNIVYEEPIYGAFWRDFRELDIPRKRLAEELAARDQLTEGDVIASILEVYRQFRGKERVGAKYPVHISRVDDLLSWFPEAKIVYLTRDPRAVVYSKLNDEATCRRKEKAGPFRCLVHAFTMAVFLFDYVRASRIYQKNKDADNWHRVRYEDLVRAPEETVRNICAFCDLGFEPQMLDAAGKPSSHHDDDSHGIHTRSARSWESMNKLHRWVIRLVTRNSRKINGYR